jgi:nucleoside-diphosphate-sugar epimerase
MLSMIYVDDLARAIVSSVNSENNVIHFSDGQIYRHSDLKLALEEAIDKPLRRIKIPPKMVKKYLRFSDSISRFMSYAPHLTLEKYEEISSNWNLTDDQALTHQKPNNPIKLTEGFAQTWKYYKSNSLA